MLKNKNLEKEDCRLHFSDHIILDKSWTYKEESIKKLIILNISFKKFNHLNEKVFFFF